MMRLGGMGLVLGVVCVLSLPAHAAPKAAPAAQKQATAEELFSRGNAAMKAGRTNEACSLFAESYRIDRAGGTLQNLAYCYETAGLWASAYARYQELLALAKVSVPPRPDRVTLAQEHIQTLTPKLSRVKVLVPPNTRAADLTVTIDNAKYKRTAWSTGLLLDPGDHVAIVNAPGKKPFKTMVSVVEGRDVSLVVPKLENAPQKAPLDPHPSRAAGVVIASAGLAVLGAGSVFGVLALMKNDEGKKACQFSEGKDPEQFDASGYCYRNSAAYDTANDKKSGAKTYANIANVAVPVGAIGVVLGGYLFFRGPSKPEKGARLVPTLGGASLVGAF